MRPEPNGLPGVLPSNVGLPELSPTWSSTSIFQMRRYKILLPRLRLMGAPRCFWGPLIVLPCLVIFEFFRRPALLSLPLGFRLLTLLLSQVEARLQALRPFILTLLYPGAESGIFVLLLTLSFRQYIKIHRLISSLLLLFCQFERLCPQAARSSLSIYALQSELLGF